MRNSIILERYWESLIAVSPMQFALINLILFHKSQSDSILAFFCEHPIPKMQSTIDYYCLDNKCSQCSTAHCLF